MRKLTFIFFLFSYACKAQEPIIKIASQISTEDLKRNLYHLASDKMEGRLMGSKGDTLASQFIAEHFKANNLKAPYKNKSYYQAVRTNRKVITEASLTIKDNIYANLNGWTFALRSTETFNLQNVPVVFAGYGIKENAYNDFANIDVKGKAVLILSGQPKDSAGIFLLSGTNKAATVTSYQNILKELGAVAVLVYNPRFRQDSLIQRRQFHGTYINEYAKPVRNLPVITLSESRVNELLAPSLVTITALQSVIDRISKPQSFDLKSNISAKVSIDLEKGIAPNVIGIIEGRSKKAGAVIISAHHDHDGRNGNNIYYGAVDNASGTVAIMEIARLMNVAKKSGIRPKRSIIFASYTGEERGLLGSHFFAENPVVPIKKTWAVLNVDMMGRVDTFYSGKRADSNYAYILVKDTLDRNLRPTVYKANESVGLKLDTYYEQPQFMQRRLAGSDQYPFYLKGVPFIRIDCGFSKDYHQLTDTPDKINYELLTNQAKLAFLTIWNMTNN
jgi:hypothetical protein